jgi:superfamily II DNA/RNA helicase
MGIHAQITGLRRPYNFIIGTPGRLKDLVDRKAIRLNEFRTIVLDEADRMLDMGFVNDMRYLMAGMAPNRQTLFFSATITSEVDRLIKEFLTNPEKISVKTGDTARNVEQDIVRIKKGEDKVDSLHQLLSQKEFSKVLIFGRTKHGVERLSKDLIKRGFKAESIHGDKNQNRRQNALRAFKENRSQILVATDVAARGLDIPNVTHVINFDVPATYEDYIHRIGRTGRANQTGIALTFVS